MNPVYHSLWTIFRIISGDPWTSPPGKCRASGEGEDVEDNHELDEETVHITIQVSGGGPFLPMLLS